MQGNKPCLHWEATATEILLGCSSVSQHVKGPSESLDFKDKKVSWTIRRLHNGEESIAQLRVGDLLAACLAFCEAAA